MQTVSLFQRFKVEFRKVLMAASSDAQDTVLERGNLDRAFQQFKIRAFKTDFVSSGSDNGLMSVIIWRMTDQDAAKRLSAQKAYALFKAGLEKTRENTTGTLSFSVRCLHIVFR